jgi:hypothetical protein
MSQANAPTKNHAAGIKFPPMEEKIERMPRLMFPQVKMDGRI